MTTRCPANLNELYENAGIHASRSSLDTSPGDLQKPLFNVDGGCLAYLLEMIVKEGLAAQAPKLE